MKIWWMALCAACTVACYGAPKYVSVPMSDVVATTTTTVIAPSNAEPEDTDSPTDDFKGSWQGTAWSVGNKAWPMIVTFEKHGAHEVVGHVSYTDRRCRADWTLRRVSSPTNHWEGAESVKIDPFSQCLNNAQIIVDVVDEDTIRWRWVGSRGQASATLQRARNEE